MGEWIRIIFYIFVSSLLQIICCVSAELLLLLLIMSFVDDDMLLLASNTSIRHRYALTAKDNNAHVHNLHVKINILMVTWYQYLWHCYLIQRSLKALIFLPVSYTNGKYPSNYWLHCNEIYFNQNVLRKTNNLNCCKLHFDNIFVGFKPF